MSRRNILLVIGRNNIIKDKELISSLKEALSDLEYEFILYESKDADTALFLQKRIQYLDEYPILRKVAKAFLLFIHPTRWDYFLSPFRKEQPIEKQVKKLKTYIQKLQEKNPHQKIIILSRSAGGRASSLIADTLGIEKLICLGYPFKHPERPHEPDRYEHLSTLRTPFLILQGERDAYGGKEIEHKYPLSPFISLKFVQTDHNFRVSEQEFNMVVQKIKGFIVDKTINKR